MEQRTDEWFNARLGKVTASKVADVVAKTRSGWGASRDNYMSDLVCERLTGEVTKFFASFAMQQGTEREPEARAAYEYFCDEDVTEVGFVVHPNNPDAGASPDGLVGTDGLVEIKCPEKAQHLRTLLGEAPKDVYIKQMQWQMACTDRKWCDFASYNPDFPEEMKLHITRIKRDDALITELETNIVEFIREVEKKTDDLRKKYMEI